MQGIPGRDGRQSIPGPPGNQGPVGRRGQSGPPGPFVSSVKPTSAECGPMPGV